jgi:hypothetical protein
MAASEPSEGISNGERFAPDRAVVNRELRQGAAGMKKIAPVIFDQ